jgi:hypothetical protein
VKDASGPVDRPPRGRSWGRVWRAVWTVALLVAASVPMALAIDRRNERPSVGHRRTRLTVAVLDAETGGPVAGARVRVYWPALWMPDSVEEVVGTTGRDGRTGLQLNCRAVTYEGLFHSRGVVVYPQAYLAVEADDYEPSEPSWLSEKTGQSRDLRDPEPPPVRLVLRRKRPGDPGQHGRDQLAGKSKGKGEGEGPRGGTTWHRGAHPVGGVRPGPWRVSARVFSEDTRPVPPDQPAPASHTKAEK